MPMRRLLTCFVIAIMFSTSCGSQPTSLTAPAALPTTGMTDLPTDGVQPWERLDDRGCVIPSSGKGAAAFSPDSEFIPGVERFAEVGQVTDSGEVSVVVAGSSQLSASIYRVSLGGAQPSAL